MGRILELPARVCGRLVDGLLRARGRGIVGRMVLFPIQLIVGSLLIVCWILVGIPAALIHCALDLRAPHNP